jgi:hypothetical protein
MQFKYNSRAQSHPEFDDGTIISDNKVEFVLTAINSNTCYLVNSLIRKLFFVETLH